MCRIQEWQLSLSYCLSYFPLTVSDAMSCPLHNLKTLWYIIMILHSKIEQVMTMCRVQKWQLLLSWGWSGGAKMLGKLPVPGRPTDLDYSRARAYCTCSRCGWGLFGHFFSHLSLLFFLPLSGRRPNID